MIDAQILTPDNFSAFGHVSRPGQGETRSIRDATVLLTKSPARFDRGETASDLALDFYEVPAQQTPLEMAMAERHPHSCQIFLPMSVRRYLIVVWPGEDPVDVPRAFVAAPGDVVTYDRGIWHHGIIALDTPAVFASLMWRTGAGDDTEFKTLENPLAVTWPDAAR